MDAISGLLFLAALALLIGGAVAAVANRLRPALSRDKIVRSDLPARLLLFVGGVALVASLALSAFIQIPAGFVGVVRQFGAVTGATLDPVSTSSRHS